MLEYAQGVFILRLKQYILLQLRADEKKLSRYREKLKGLEGYKLYTRMDKGKIRYRYRTETMAQPDGFP